MNHDSPHPDPPERRRSILVVDDEPGIREILSHWLASAGYEVSKAAGGQEALDLIKSQGTPFDLVIIDMIMPDMAGPELMEQITRLHRGTRSLYMTGHSNLFNLKNGRPQAHIIKPSTRQNLLQVVRDALAT